MSKSLLNKSFETPYATLAELEGQARRSPRRRPYHAKAVASFLAGEPAAFDWEPAWARKAADPR